MPSRRPDPEGPTGPAEREQRRSRQSFARFVTMYPRGAAFLLGDWRTVTEVREHLGLPEGPEDDRIRRFLYDGWRAGELRADERAPVRFRAVNKKAPPGG